MSRSYHLNRYHERRNKMLEILGGACTACTTEDNLEIDHVDPRTKSFNLSEGWGRPWSDLLEELAKCQLLCKSCHKKKSDNYQTTRVHGTYAMYRRGKCRCDPCVDAGRSYMREYHRRRAMAR